MSKNPILILVLLGCISSPIFGQHSDSLLSRLDTANGENKVKILNELFRANLSSDPVKALGYAREALNLATEINDMKGKAAAYNNLGVAYRNQGALDKALEYYINSMKIYDSLDYKVGIATTQNNIANIYSIKKDYKQAMHYLETSSKLFNEIGDQHKIIGSLNNLGNLYSDMQDYEKASKYFSEAYQLSETQGQKFADPLTNMANIYFRQGNYEKAIEQYQQALVIEKENNNKLGVLNVLTNLGIAYTKARDIKSSQKCLSEAITLSDELQAFASLPTIYKASAENFYNLGKMKEAYETQLKYDEVKEKLFGDESSRKIAQMEMAMNFQEKEKELEIIKRESEIKSLELKNTRLFITMVILGVLVILAFINLFYLDRKRKLFSNN